MGQQQSKDELLYQQVSYGNAQGIKKLRSEGAGLEWIDREGKTPLILACMNAELYNVAKTLIELGANVNAYRAGRQAGTPLHHAAKRGLENIVKLLLSHGANPLMMNDDCLTPLEVARAKGYSNVVRAIENHICLFSGWMREFYGPGFLEVLAPQFLSRKVWVVILPTGSRNLRKPFKLEMAIYSDLPDSKPRTLIGLWKANLEDLKLNQPDPSVVIVENSTIPRGRRRRRRCRPQTIRQTRIKLAPVNENDRQQLQQFSDACKGIPQAVHPLFLHDSQRPPVQATAPPDAGDFELAMAINASIQSAIEETSNFHVQSTGEASTSASRYESLDGYSHGGPSNQTSTPPKERAEAKLNSDSSLPTVIKTSDANSIPSAPQIAHEIIEDGPVQYPSIDSSPVVMSSPSNDSVPAANTGERKDDGGCAICLDAPSEAACVPCGHVAGCVSCLNEIKAKKWGCPVCRARIEQVIKIYRV